MAEMAKMAYPLLAPTGVAGQDGNNGKVGITGADGKDAVSISGKDGVGHIELNRPCWYKRQGRHKWYRHVR